jgi:3-hydroxyisobutyrate dehydrogenase-like beta-hydroxyacid dehydrogenase
MAGRLLSEGIAGSSEDTPLVVWNRSRNKCEEFKSKFPEKYIVVKSSPKEVVEACGITFSMLSTPEASKEVFEAEDGVLSGISSGKSIVDCATLSEADMLRMNSEVLSKGGRFLEAPVSGSKIPAATGQLIFLCAGSKDLFDEISVHLAAMGKASYFFSSDVGLGTRAKLVINALMGTMVAACGEALSLAESVGLDANQIIEVIGQSAIASPVYALKGPKMLSSDHSPHFPLKHAHKDIKLASEMAKRAGVEFAVINQAEALFSNARHNSELNLADLDFSAVMEEIRSKSTPEMH